MPIPRTNFLADVAAEDPVAEAGPQGRLDGAVVFDREGTDAAGGVEHPRPDEGLRGTGVEAGRARAAVIDLER